MAVPWVAILSLEQLSLELFHLSVNERDGVHEALGVGFCDYLDASGLLPALHFLPS